jgi:hypothetical protein
VIGALVGLQGIALVIQPGSAEQRSEEYGRDQQEL